MREVRAFALAAGPLPASRPAAAFVREGDLAVSLSDPAAAAALFHKTGLVVFGGAAPTALVDGCRGAFAETRRRVDLALLDRGIGIHGDEGGQPSYMGFEVAFNEVCQRGRERLDIRGLGMAKGEPALAHASPMLDARLHASASWLPFVRAVLGANAHECFRGVVDNRPGSGAQEWHADGVHANYEDGATAPLGVAAWHAKSGALGASGREEAAQRLTLFLPLTDLADPACGAAEFFPGSHTHATANLYRHLHPTDHESQPNFCAPRPAYGGMIAFDYRLVHRGCPNTRARGGASRPILYIVYARGGCTDEQTFPTDKPLFRYGSFCSVG